MSSFCAHNFAVTVDKEVYGWGSNKDCRLMKVEKLDEKNVMQPVKIKFFWKDVNIKVRKIECGYDFSCIVDVEGNVYTWGANDCGQLGHGKTKKKIKRK